MGQQQLFKNFLFKDMKKNRFRILSVILTIVAIYNNPLYAISSVNCSNSNSSFNVVSDFDEAEIYNAFSEINNLVNFVSANDSVTYSDIQTQDSSLLLLHDTDSDVAFNHPEKFSFNKQTAFLSGCFFGPIGMVLVAIINNGDQERLKSAVWGCVTSGCVSLASVLAVYFVFFSYLALYW
jgi:hypothetical protein